MVHLRLFSLCAICLCVRSVEIVRNHTIVRFDSRMTIKDDSGNATEFGLSLAMVGQNGTGWAFIGAPNAENQNRDPAKFGSRHGKVWRCSLGTKPSCIVIDYTDQLCVNETGNTMEQKKCENMRLGQTVLATSKIVIACAPKWSRLRGNKTDLRQRLDGACLWTLTNDSLKDQVKIPRTNRNRLFPFVSNDYSTPHYQYTSNSSDKVFRWFFAEFGFSAHMSREENFVSGTPGVLVDQGGVIVSPILTNKTDSEWKWKMFHFERIQDRKTFNQAGGYLGYAVTSGYYFKSKEEMIVASAPRAQGQPLNKSEQDLLGAVVMMTYDKALRSEDVIQVGRKPGMSLWEPDVVLAGQYFGSYFGAALATLDINKDHLDDLLVGAPFQNGADDSGDITKANAGCVYIYSHKWIQRDISSNSWNYSKILCESSKPFSRFGTTIANLGDIDYDGFNDFAVGAPYDENGAGAVYIYFGQEDWKTEFKLIRVVGKSNNAGFGHSIFGNVDIDGNDTPGEFYKWIQNERPLITRWILIEMVHLADFVVGSYLAQEVTLFRTRPKLEVELTLQFYYNDIKEAPIKLRLSDEKFSFQYCIEIKLIPTESREIKRKGPIEIWNQLALDEDFNRFQISNELDFKLSVSENVSKVCKDVAVTRSNKTEDLENDEDVQVTALVFYNTTFSSHSYAKINSQPEISMRHEGNFEDFCSNCPFPMQRRFKGPDYVVSFAMDCKERWDTVDLPVCSPLLNLTMRVTSGENENVVKLVLGKTRGLKVIVTVKNDHQTAFNPELGLTWRWANDNNRKLAMEPPKFVRTRLHTRENCTASNLCEVIHQKLRKNRQKTIDYTLNFDNVVAVSREPATLHLQAKVYLQNDTSFTAVERNATVHVIYDASVRVRSAGMEILLPLSAPRALSANFKLETKGETLVKAKVYVGLPLSLSKGSYFEKQMSVETAKGWNCTPEIRWPGMSRQKLKPLEAETKRADVNCFVDRTSCIYFFCTKNITKNHDVAFPFNVTEANALRMKNILERIGRPVELAGFAYVNIFEDDSQNDSDHSVTLFKMTIKPADTLELAAWIIILAAGCGLIVVCCIMFALFRCGFFRRKAKEDLARMIAQAEVEEAEAACTKQASLQSSDFSENDDGNLRSVSENQES